MLQKELTWPGVALLWCLLRLNVQSMMFEVSLHLPPDVSHTTHLDMFW